MLLPPDLREWVPEDGLVHFAIEAVDGLPLEIFQANQRGTSSPGSGTGLANKSHGYALDST